ncbi:MAG: hypothetical protein RBT71_13995, partial [Flavobacteriales bacterium]|nr:hypothetical protein [Flavobacteriales bacterium]
PPVIHALAQLIGYIKTGVFGDAHAVQEYHLKTDDEVVRALTASLRERINTYYTLPMLVESYTLSKFHYKKDRHYNDLSAYFGIDFNASIEKKLNSRSRKEKMDFQHHYVHLFNYMCNVLFNDLHYDRISDPHPKLGEPITENIHFYLTKHFPPAHHGRLAADKVFRHQSILDLLVDLVEVLYFDKQPGYLAQGT